MPQEFDVVCLGGGVAGEATAAGLRDSVLTLIVVERELVGGQCPYRGCIPSKTLRRSGAVGRQSADGPSQVVMHLKSGSALGPAFNRILGASFGELAAQAAARQRAAVSVTTANGGHE